MNSIIVNKLLPITKNCLEGWFDRIERSGCVIYDSILELRLVVEDKGVSITEHGYLIDNLEAPLPRIDLTTDKLRLELQTTLILDYTEQYDLGDTDYALSTRFYVYRPIASGVGLDSLINDLQTATTTTLGIRIGEEDLVIRRS
jgi:hypothetical protein